MLIVELNSPVTASAANGGLRRNTLRPRDSTGGSKSGACRTSPAPAQPDGW